MALLVHVIQYAGDGAYHHEADKDKFDDHVDLAIAGVFFGFDDLLV